MKAQHTHTAIVTLFLLAFFSLGAGNARAQDDEARPKVSGGYGFFTPGYSFHSLSPMNSYLGTDGFSAMDDNNFTLGGGGFVMIRNIIIGGAGHSFLKKESASPDQAARLDGGWGQFQVGYVVFSKKGLLIYPKVGVGGYNHRLTLTDRDGPTNVSQTLNSEYPGTELIRKGLLLSGEVGVDFMPGFDESSGSGLVFGLSVGYNYAANQGAWTAYEQELAGGPGIDMSGLHVTLRIGGGGWHRQ